MEYILLLFAGLAIGALLVYFLFIKGKSKQAPITTISSTTVLEKMERVFKVVVAEGFFSEIYDYKHSEKILYFLPQTKKALLIVNAKVMMGYDFKKFKYELNSEDNKVRIIEFPPCEILSIDPDVKYYNVEDNLFNKFSTEDLTTIQSEAKKKIMDKVLQSDLPKIAAKQMQSLLQEMGNMGQFKITGLEQIERNESKFNDLKSLSNSSKSEW